MAIMTAEGRKKIRLNKLLDKELIEEGVVLEQRFKTSIENETRRLERRKKLSDKERFSTKETRVTVVPGETLSYSEKEILCGCVESLHSEPYILRPQVPALKICSGKSAALWQLIKTKSNHSILKTNRVNCIDRCKIIVTLNAEETEKALLLLADVQGATEEEYKACIDLAISEKEILERQNVQTLFETKLNIEFSTGGKNKL